jgi:hypothetical protein
VPGLRIAGAPNNALEHGVLLCLRSEPMRRQEQRHTRPVNRPEIGDVADRHHVDLADTLRFTLSRALGDAADLGAELVVVRLDTPGGLVTAMRDMVRDIFASRVPVVVYVAPEGSRAASAGTFVAASAGVAAMAPATNIGAA